MTYLYPTASTIAVFLNGYHVEQSYQIQYKESAPKMPIYGYNDYTYSKVAHGRSLVNGILVINFIFAGYLNTILNKDYGAYVPRLYNYGFAEEGETQKDRLIKDIQKQFRTELPPNSSSEDRAARAAMIASLITKDESTKDATKKALERFLTPSKPDGNRIESAPSSLRLPNNSITLDIYYQDPELATWFLRFEKVHFYEVSQVGSIAGAEGSSDPLYEVYSFVSSKKTIRLIGEIE